MQVITANRLADGAVVYMTEAGSWSRDIVDGRAFEKSAAADELARAEKSVTDCVVVAPYAIDVDVTGERIHAVRYREQIRALGPTVPGATVTA
jgi:sulfite reductase (NADPH) hemoprotein beta-component